MYVYVYAYAYVYVYAYEEEQLGRGKKTCPALEELVEAQRAVPHDTPLDRRGDCELAVGAHLECERGLGPVLGHELGVDVLDRGQPSGREQPLLMQLVRGADILVGQRAALGRRAYLLESVRVSQSVSHVSHVSQSSQSVKSVSK